MKDTNGQGNSGKHTPGPWKYDAGLDNWDNVFTDTDPPSHIASVYGADVSDGHDEYAANARLIAAAPDLLESVLAAQPMLVLFYSCAIKARDTELADRISMTMDCLSAAMNKATGGAA